MSPEIIGVSLLLLVVAFILFKLIRKIIAFVITMVVVILLVLIGFGLLVMKDIQTFRNHPTKELLMVLSSESGTSVYSAAVFAPRGQRAEEGEATENETGSSGEDSEEKSRDFTLLDGKSLKKLNADIVENRLDGLLQQYVKVIIVKPSAIPLLVKSEVNVFDLPFNAAEIVTLIESDDPQSILAKKTLDERKINVANFMKVFKSDATIKGSIFFGAIFEQIRKDHVPFVVGLVQSLSDRTVIVHEETLAFRVMTWVPVSLASDLLTKIRDAFGEGGIKLPDFGGSLKGTSKEQTGDEV